MSDHKDKIVLEIDGKQIDLREVIASASIDQLKEMGFPIGNDGKFSIPTAVAPAAKSKEEAEDEKMADAANFIRNIVIPARMHKQFGIKEIQLKEAGNTGAGSFGAAVPTYLADQILARKGKFAVIRSRAFAFELSGTYDLPVEGDGITGYWVTEVDAADANKVTESDPTLTKKTLEDHYLAALVKVSWKLLNTSDKNIVNYIAALAGRKLSETEEAAFIGGNGSGKPKGIRSESIESIAQEGETLAYQDIINTYFLLPAQYRANAVWITSALGAKAITGLKDGEGHFIYPPGQPLDELFRKPLLESADIPENLGTGTDETEVYFGDPYYYWIKDGQSMQMATQDVVERLQTKIVVYQAVDGKLVLSEAWVKLTGVKVATVES